MKTKNLRKIDISVDISKLQKKRLGPHSNLKNCQKCHKIAQYNPKQIRNKDKKQNESYQCIRVY